MKQDLDVLKTIRQKTLKDMKEHKITYESVGKALGVSRQNHLCFLTQ